MMIDMVGGVLGMVLVALGHAVRYMSAAAALLLILRAVFVRDVRNASWFGRPLYAVTAVFERPVRRVLPDSVIAAPFDYAPVVAAMLLLLLGLGVHEFFDVLAHELLPIPSAP